MKTLIITAPARYVGKVGEWEVQYEVHEQSNTRLIKIAFHTPIEVIVTKFSRNTLSGNVTSYYVSSPSCMIAIPPLWSLSESYWMTENLLFAGVTIQEAITITQVLRDIGDF